MPKKNPLPKAKSKKPKSPSRSRPETTLFLVNSVDGRITSHDSDPLDPDKDWKRDPKIQAITQPFFDFARGEIHTVTYGESLARIGINQRSEIHPVKEVRLIVIDHQNNLRTPGIDYLTKTFHTIYLVTLPSHPLLKITTHPPNLKFIIQKNEIDFAPILTTLYKKYKVKQVSIQSNARLNARWLSAGLIDYLSVIISPLLVGRHGTPNLIDQDLLTVKPLILTDMKAFGLDFVNLRYDVVNS
jgi:2,5-diamino-6-(ribosylamino)-4(3H)-pyrimidinone 5'-phosphate reductase